MKQLFSTILFVTLFAVVFSCSTTTTPVNGYRTTVGEGTDQISLVVVHGTPYEMGFALGQLMQKEAHACISGFLKFGQENLPERFSDEKLDAAWNSIAPFTDARFKAELKGVAEGSGIPLITLQRVHAIPVIADYACSGVAVWGAASQDQHLYQLRNLDFEMQAELQEYPVIVIYQPKDGIAHAIVTFAGYIGAHTGINAEGLVLGEKGGSPKKEYPFDLNGTHFTTLFRDLLYDAAEVPAAVKQIQAAKLIKRYHFYVGDGKSDAVQAVKILISTPDSIQMHIWGANDPTDEVAPHVLENTIYFTMDNELAFGHLKQNAGQYIAEKMIELSRAVANEGGNLMNVVYDGTTLEMWVAVAEKSADASLQPYVHVPLKEYLQKVTTP